MIITKPCRDSAGRKVLNGTRGQLLAADPAGLRVQPEEGPAFALRTDAAPDCLRHGYALTVQGRLTVNGPLLNATGVISYLDRAGNLPPGAIRLLGDAAHDIADLDGDGLGSLMEFVLGTNPGVVSPNALPVPAVAGGFLTLTYRTPAGIGGVHVIVEVSNDMANWFTGPGFTSVTSDTIVNGVRTVTVRDDQGGALQYMRLRVTR